MADIQVTRDDVELDAPTLVEGLPGVGLVGKIAADHLVEAFDMTEYATVHCDGLPEIAVYRKSDPAVRPPVRLYVDEERDLLVLQSDAPISASAAEEFAGCVTEWLQANDVTPIYLSGRPAEKDGVPSLYGIATGEGEGLLREAGVDSPTENGGVTGPTGALLYEAQRAGVDGVGLVVEADRRFPDPEAARVILTQGIAPLAGVDVPTDKLVEQAEEISEARAQLAEQMGEAEDESTSARPLGMFQ
ncbi:proteasome assembly chaperone family protein [Halomicrobium salinisoli]|uniref:proteasome assembly chaperone family protein n=1 Tax=Halomicrobium salinisoli TaxID=2878391 RepID=UPI001CF06915|nr:PAC2 family protein [Halomicrobium salinisoli]